MTTTDFDASSSSPRRGLSVAEDDPCYHASIADVTDEEHQNMTGLVQPDDFNADVIVRFLHGNGIDASVDESTGGFRFKVDDPAHESHVRFACVCLRASISYALEAAFWCIKAKR